MTTTAATLIKLDVAAARDAQHVRIRMLKAGYHKEAAQALGMRVACMTSAYRHAGREVSAEYLSTRLGAQ